MHSWTPGASRASRIRTSARRGVLAGPTSGIRG